MQKVIVVNFIGPGHGIIFYDANASRGLELKYGINESIDLTLLKYFARTRKTFCYLQKTRYVQKIRGSIYVLWPHL